MSNYAAEYELSTHPDLYNTITKGTRTSENRTNNERLTKDTE